MLNPLEKPLIIGHRGACALAPENTMSSFRLAFEHKADGIEFDTKLSRDGEVVIIHDQTLERTTNGSGKVIETSLENLKNLDAGSKFSPTFAGEKIPTLDELFKELGGKIFMNIELTNYASPSDALVDKVVELIRKYKIENSVMFSSFNANNLAKAQRLIPEVPTGLLALKGWMGAFSRYPFGLRVSPEYTHPYFSDAPASFISAEHGRGRRVNVWTVNDPKDVRRLVHDHVDGIMGDDPRMIRQALEG
jgi:glycerophosphoryl diester phosphodiesterase